MHVNQVTASHFKPESPIPVPILSPNTNPLHTYSCTVSCGTWGKDVRRARMQRTLCDKQVHPLAHGAHWPDERLTMLVRQTANKSSHCQRILMINCHNKPEPEPSSRKRNLKLFKISKSNYKSAAS